MGSMVDIHWTRSEQDESGKGFRAVCTCGWESIKFGTKNRAEAEGQMHSGAMKKEKRNA